MKKLLFTLLIIIGLTQITQSQVTCEQMNLIVNVGSVPDYVNLYHPGNYLISPPEENTIEWEITDNQGNIIAEEILVNESFFTFDHNLPTTDTINISVVITNNIAGVSCLIEDVLYWEETEVIPGVFTYRWEFLYGNVGSTFSVNDLKPTSISVYPNPSNDLINIKLDDNQLSKIELYDITGKLLFKKNLKANNYVLNIANYPSGIYLLKIFNQNSMFINKKVIKK
jgi:hypothetical protein|tara:strand:+ start:1450 stop:2127 length:678 start_codon:yes stop_codon:yes gene_type:complete